MKYPVYVEVRHRYLDGFIRYLVESDEMLEGLVGDLQDLEREVPNIGCTFRFAGYPSVVGNLITGLVK